MISKYMLKKDCGWTVAKTALRFIYIFVWSDELTSIKWVKWEIDLSNCIVIDWNSYMSEFCMYDFLERLTGKIGVRKMIVEIDWSFYKAIK